MNDIGKVAEFCFRKGKVWEASSTPPFNFSGTPSGTPNHLYCCLDKEVQQ